MQTISKKITSVSVGEIKPEVAPVPELESLTIAMKRPDVLMGATYKMKPPTSDHALYITINDVILNEGTEHEERRPFEIFINSKNMEFYSWVVAMTRVISAVFRTGGDCAFLVDELKAVFDPQGGYYQSGGTGVFMPSIVAELGHVLEKHLKRVGVIEVEKMAPERVAYIEEKKAEVAKNNDVDSNGYPANAKMCNKCQQKAVVNLDGCDTCLSCADSKCG